MQSMRLLMRMFCILVCSLSLHVIVKGQQNRLLFHPLGVNEGLSHSSVYSILQDKQGFIWIGTADGLNKYDGKGVTVYRPREALRNPEAAYIRDRLAEDSKGNIWYANSTGIYCLDARTKELVQKKALKDKSIAVYGLDEHGYLWIHDIHKGIFRYNIHTGDTATYPYPFIYDHSKYRLTKVTSDDRSALWFSIYDNGEYYRFDIGTGKYTRFKYGTAIHLLQYVNGDLWVSDGRTIASFNGATMGQRSDFPWRGAIPGKMNLLIDKVGHLWISTSEQGLYKLDRSGSIIKHYSRNNYSAHTLSSDIINAMMEDRGENLWVATDGGGLCRADLKPQAFGKFPVEERDYPQLKDLLVWSLYEAKDRKVWFSTHKGGLNTFDLVTGVVQHIPIPQLKKESHIATIFKAHDNVMWLGYTGGVGYLHEGNLHTVPLQIPKYFSTAGSPFIVYKLLEAGNNMMLLATSAGLRIIVRNNGKWVEQKLSIPITLSKKATDIITDSGGRYWLASPSGGLCHFQLQDNTLVVLDSFASGETIRSIHRDEINKDILWLSSKAGLWKFSTADHSARLLTTNDGLANANVYGILEDEDHDLWISTNGGLSRYNREHGTFSNYSYSSGLQSSEFNSSAFHKGASGNLYFGGVKGFNWFTAATVSFDTARPQVAITGITAGDSLLQLHDGNTVDLPYRRNSFNLLVAVLDYTRPEANLIQYKLEGWDKGWITAVAGEIRYANLPPGNYVLHVYGVGSNKVRSDVYTLRVNILAPFWQQVWFRAVSILFALVLITLSVFLWCRERMRKTLRELRQQKMLAAERNRISQDLHDEIGSAITQISLISDLLPIQRKEGEALLEDVKVISVTAKKVAHSMSDIVWTLQYQHDSLENLLAYLREQVREFLDPIGIRYEIDFPFDVPSVQLSGERRRNLLLVTKEALNNAVKYSQATCIKVSCNYESRMVIFKVADDGIGFDLRKMNGRGNGLKNMQKRMLAIGGEIAWDHAHKGTCVIYSVTV